jgi:hypothetical protein
MSDPVTLSHTAAAALTALCAAADDAAREVEAAGGQRTARDSLLPLARANAVNALRALHSALPLPAFAEIAEACAGGFVRPSWALWIVRLATEAHHG